MSNTGDCPRCHHSHVGEECPVGPRFTPKDIAAPSHEDDFDMSDTPEIGDDADTLDWPDDPDGLCDL